jgi:DNA-binding protein HU-beta
MNKSELIEAIAAQADVPKAQAGRVLDAMVAVVGDALAEGKQVSMVGFGTFLVRERPARSGRNPRTGETINIAASRTPSFKAGKALKDKVN